MADGQTLPINERVAIPLTFANGRTISFEMLVLEDLSHDTVFGQNRLGKLDATIDFYQGKLLFVILILMLHFPVILCSRQTMQFLQ